MTALTLIKAEAAAERARLKLGTETGLVVAEIVAPGDVLDRYNHRAPRGMKLARQSRG
jgi:hypothetical protein